MHEPRVVVALIMLQTVLTTLISHIGSWRPENTLQLWDYTSGELIETIPYSVPIPVCAGLLGLFP